MVYNWFEASKKIGDDIVTGISYTINPSVTALTGNLAALYGVYTVF